MYRDDIHCTSESSTMLSEVKKKKFIETVLVVREDKDRGLYQVECETVKV